MSTEVVCVFLIHTRGETCVCVYFFLREREKERNISLREKYRLAAFCTHPDRGLNPQTFGTWGDGTILQPTEPLPRHERGNFRSTCTEQTALQGHKAQ